MGIPDNVWQDLRKFIVSTIDKLGDQFRPVFKAAWLAYINEVYPVDAPVHESQMSGSVLIDDQD